ncbi:MAG: hypothetical protein Roseis2KO_01570 [Roseivirga sp.]
MAIAMGSFQFNGIDSGLMVISFSSDHPWANYDSLPEQDVFEYINFFIDVVNIRAFVTQIVFAFY